MLIMVLVPCVRVLGHGKPADWWALGVLIYEMLTGRTPFQASNRKVIHQNILNMKITFPNFISPDCKSLLKGLLSRHIPKRLGYNVREHRVHPSCLPALVIHVIIVVLITGLQGDQGARVLQRHQLVDCGE